MKMLSPPVRTEPARSYDLARVMARHRLFSGLILAAICLLPQIRSAELFGPAGATFGVGDKPGSVAVADLNADGILDVAVANFDDFHVDLLYGDGLGGFRPATTIAIGERQAFIVEADFNADGARDLAVTLPRIFSVDDGAVRILLGDRAGGFNLGQEIPVQQNPRTIAVADLNGDGAVDLAVANRNSSSVSILLGDGRGEFSREHDLPVSALPFGLAAGEFDGDGDLDLAVAHFSCDGTVSVLEGDGTGSFEPANVVEVGPGPTSIAVGDFDTNGLPDLALSNSHLGCGPSSAGSLSILIGDGELNFERLADIDLGGQPASVVVDDFNADGAVDLVVTRPEHDLVSVLLGDGGGGFSRTADLGAGADPQAVGVGDFDSDGATDLAVSNFFEFSVTSLLGDGIGGFLQAPLIRVDVAPRFVARGDFNEDGLTDLALTARRFTPDGVFSHGAVVIHEGDGTGGFSSIHESIVGDDPSYIVVADFDGDGHDDLAVSSFDDSLTILGGDGTGKFEQLSQQMVGASPTAMLAGRLDADEKIDLATTNSIGNAVNLFIGDGNGEFERREILLDPGSSPHSLALGLFDGDEHEDLAVALRSHAKVGILSGDGAGGFTLERRIPVERNAAPTSIVAADFNGDAMTDLALANNSRKSVSVLLRQGNRGFRLLPEITVGIRPLFLEAGDFNDDALVDLAVTNSASASVSILLGDGEGGFVRPPDVTVASGPSALSVADLDGAGGIDIAVANTSGDSVSLLFNQLVKRSDLNGSNRTDGFDVNTVQRLAGLAIADPGYQRNADIDLNGIIDGHDLALVADRFGEFNKVASPLRAEMEEQADPEPETITFKAVSTEGDQLSVAIDVNQSPALVASGELTVTFLPDDGEPGQVLEWIGFEPGSYLSGGVGQSYDVRADFPGRTEVTAVRLPPDLALAGSGTLLTLIFEAKRAGDALLEFGDGSHLLDGEGSVVVPPEKFIGGAAVSVAATAGGPPGQKIGFAPALLDFGQVEPGEISRRTLRISNFGFSELEVLDVTSVLPEFSSFFSAGFAIPPFGSVEIPVEFSHEATGLFSVDLVIESSDPQNRLVRVPMLARTGLPLIGSPLRIDFGRVRLGSSETQRLILTNRGETALDLTRIATSDQRFSAVSSSSSIAPDETVFVDVSFQATAGGEAHGLLQLEFDVAAERKVVIGLSAAVERGRPPEGKTP